MKKIVGIVSLGCAKNQSDTEVLCGYLMDAGMTLTGDVSEADVVIVNTCALSRTSFGDGAAGRRVYRD